MTKFGILHSKFGIFLFLVFSGFGILRISPCNLTTDCRHQRTPVGYPVEAKNLYLRNLHQLPFPPPVSCLKLKRVFPQVLKTGCKPVSLNCIINCQITKNTKTRTIFNLNKFWAIFWFGVFPCKKRGSNINCERKIVIKL